MMRNERGSIPAALIFAMVIVAGLFIAMAVCGDLIFEDEDEENDLGWGFVGLATVVAGHDGDDEDHHNQRNRNGNDCNRARAACSDDDFSPSFDKSPVEDSFNPTICLPFADCRPDDEEAA